MYLHAFTHDLSKLLPLEFIPYANYDFKYLENNSKEDLKKLNIAWQHHYKYNKHHWHYWAYDLKTYQYYGEGTERKMPLKYIKQMICDWKAMARKFGDTPQGYYLKNYREIKLHKDSRLTLERELGLCVEVNHDKIIVSKNKRVF